MRRRWFVHACTSIVASITARVLAAPATTPWPVEGPDDTVAAACAALSGWYATADSFEDSVEVRDVNQSLLATITRSQIEALLPWMSLGGGPDGPSGLVWSDSGRSLFILVHDAALPADGLGSDAVLRLDSSTGELSVFARLDLFDRDDEWPHLAAAFFRARLFVGTYSNGVRVLFAGASEISGSVLGTVTLPDNGPVHGLAVDRDNALLYAASGSSLYRGSASTSSPTFTLVGSLTEILALSYREHYGGAGNEGLYVLTGGASGSTLSHVPIMQARGLAAFAPTTYLSILETWHDIAASADGTLLAGADEDAVRVCDTADTRWTFGQWLQDEFDQVVAFAKSLISPDGEPLGWVIDADVQIGWSRFHPATPDGACWTILAMLMADHVNADPEARDLVREILVRYAGMAGDGIAPSASPDGYIRHWIDPLTGGVKPGGWNAEFAAYSAMKIAVAAERALAFYPDDPVIEEAANRIMCRIADWNSYIQPVTDAVYLISLPGGGPDLGPRNFPFSEGIIFVEQASVYGGAASAAPFNRWLDREMSPFAQTLPGKPVSTDTNNVFQSAFLSLYPLLLQKPFRQSAAWQTHIRNLLESNGGWTDDNGPRYYTVFSAGTTPSGYNADSLSNHPNNLSGFPALMAFCGTGHTQPAVAAYQAYRRGARQTFSGGASILYRRSDTNKAYQPNSAGLPDVVLGGLGLAELLAPGSVDTVLARDYSPYACPPDVNASGRTDIEDLYAWHQAPADLDRDDAVSAADEDYLVTYLRRREASDGAQSSP